MLRNRMIVMLAVLAAAVAVGVVSASGTAPAELQLKAGDHVYACNCSDKCPCGMLSHEAGSCTCGEDMVEAEVVSVGEGTATLKAEGWEKPREFKTSGAYHCACGPKCTCGTVSQQAGACPCGSDMVKTDES